MADEWLLFSDSGISFNKRPPYLAIAEQGTDGLRCEQRAGAVMKRENITELGYGG